MAVQNVFTKLAQKAIAQGAALKNMEDARAWFRREARKQTRVTPEKLLQTAGPFKTLQNLASTSVGKMYMFMYDPKWKDELPYYDKFPLIFPIEFYKDGFLGINLHYLPPAGRAKLMDALYDTLTNDKYDYTTKLRINYSILSSTRKFNLFKPCIKRYLFTHVRSSFQFVNPKDWDKALFLPVERFQKATKTKVYADSMNIARGR